MKKLLALALMTFGLSGCYYAVEPGVVTVAPGYVDYDTVDVTIGYAPSGCWNCYYGGYWYGHPNYGGYYHGNVWRGSGYRGYNGYNHGGYVNHNTTVNRTVTRNVTTNRTVTHNHR